jgi:hypothetical protein
MMKENEMVNEKSPVLIFFRKDNGEDFFYPVEADPRRDLKEQAEKMAIINPGTLRVEDINGNILWRPQ